MLLKFLIKVINLFHYEGLWHLMSLMRIIAIICIPVKAYLPVILLRFQLDVSINYVFHHRILRENIK